MAGGIDWFRWHHGSVTDPKFQLIARKCGVRLGDVIATWAFLLEQASASTDRGSFGDLDFETLDFLLGTDDGVAERIVSAFVQRGMVGGQRIASWEKRQPKRERDPAPVSEDATPPMTSTERSRRHRAKQGNSAPDDATQRHATPCNASDDHATPREEERREEFIDAAQGAANKRGTRLPQDWVLPKHWGEWALAEFKTWTPEVVRIESDKFRDFWTSKAGREAAKLDWHATWRNWCRNAKPNLVQAQTAKVSNIFAGAI